MRMGEKRKGRLTYCSRSEDDIVSDELTELHVEVIVFLIVDWKSCLRGDHVRENTE